MIDRDLLDILACPENKTPVKLADQPLIDTINCAIEK
ncbi:MAG: Trm112 family protein, partial [Gemmatimonadetes bacterium]|nr:Trm112 family protein [Gemmatimonadota bacterium]